MIKLEHDRKSLWQWDINQRVIIEDIEPGTLVHFESVPVTPYEENGVTYADIPNDLLQKSYLMNVYAYVFSGDDGYTKENAIFNINKREKPEDYDANVMFSDTVDEILGEVVNGGLADKLAYLKDCLNILYQSPPIKLMREVYGENKSLKELCGHLGDREEQLNEMLTNPSFTYSFSNVSVGFAEKYNTFNNPDGSIINTSLSYFKVPKIKVLPQNGTIKLPFVIGGNAIGADGDLSVDLSRIDFMDKVGTSSGMNFYVYCKCLHALWLPCASLLFKGCIKLSSTNKRYAVIENGLHLGKNIVSCESTWLFDGININPSEQPETPVYCDKDFIGTIYLEKLNIPLDCIIGIMENASYSIDDRSDPILSIGDFNLNKLFSYIDSEITEEKEGLIDEVFGRIENEEITMEQGMDEIKQIDYIYGVFFEFERMKGWIYQ